MEDLGSLLGDHGEHLPVLRVHGRSAGMLSWLDGIGQGHLNLASWQSVSLLRPKARSDGACRLRYSIPLGPG